MVAPRNANVDGPSCDLSSHKPFHNQENGRRALSYLNENIK